ncbi:MAG: hypothetical protein ACOCY1_04685 [Halovenus sp.]
MTRLKWLTVWRDPDADREEEIDFQGTGYVEEDGNERVIKIPERVYRRSSLPSDLLDYCIVYADEDTVYPGHGVGNVSIVDQDRDRGKVHLTVPIPKPAMFP